MNEFLPPMTPRTTTLRHGCSIDTMRRVGASQCTPDRISSRTARHHRSALPETVPTAVIGLEDVASITIASMAHLLISELGDFSLTRDRERAPQRLLRHQADSKHRLGGPRYAVDHVRPCTPPGWAGTRGYLREALKHA